MFKISKKFVAFLDMNIMKYRKSSMLVHCRATDSCFYLDHYSSHNPVKGGKKNKQTQNHFADFEKCQFLLQRPFP